MSAIRSIQNSFVGGELSTAVWGRHDLEAYFKGAARLENFMVLKAGGARKRYGIQAVDTAVGDYLPPNRTFKLIPYRYDRTHSAVLILSTPLSGNSQLRLADKALGWSVDPYGAAALDFRIEPEDLPAVRHRQVGDTIFLASGSGRAVRKILVAKEARTESAPPFSGLSAANASATRAFYADAEWNTDYCPLGLSFGQYVNYTTAGSNYPDDIVNYIIQSSGQPFKYLVVPVFADGHEMFPETDALDSRMSAAIYILTEIYNGTGLYPYTIPKLQIRAKFYSDRIPPSVKIFRSDSGSYANLRLLATIATNTAEVIETGTTNGRATKTLALTKDTVKTTLSSTLVSADRATNGFERTATYYAVGTTGGTTFKDTDASRLSVQHLANSGAPATGRAVALAVGCVKASVPDTITVYRGIADLGGTADAIKIATINTAAGTVTTAAGTAAITPTDSADGTTRTYTVTDTGTAVTPAVTHTPSTNAFAWTNYSAAVSTLQTAAKPTAPASLAAAVTGMSGSYVKKYAAYGVSGGVFSAPATATASIATTWTAGAYVTLTATFPASRGYDKIVLGKMAAGIYGQIATVYPGDSGWVESNGTVTVTVTDDNVTPSDAIYSQTNVIDSAATAATSVYGSDVDVLQQRLAVSGGDGIPFSLQFSAVGDLANFWASRPAQTDEAFQMTLAVSSPSDIRHMLAFRNYILCFSDGGVYRLQGAGSAGFSYSSAAVDRISDIGCAPDVRPIETINGVLFAGADLRTVYELKYDLQQDSVVPVDRSVLADHLTYGKRIVCAAHQRYPESIVWCVLDDGTLAGFTYQPEHGVYAWHRHSVPYASIIDAVETGTVTDDLADGQSVSDILFAAVGADGKTRLCAFSGDRRDTAAGTDAAGTDRNADVRAVLVTLRPELPDRNIQGLAKSIADCLVRVRDTARLSVKPGDSDDATVDATAVEPAAGEPYTGNVKLAPRGLINDDGVMTLVSESGPCEIQCVVWRIEL